MAEIHGNGDEKPPGEPREEFMGPRGDDTTQSESVLVQIHLHGRNAGKYRRYERKKIAKLTHDTIID